MRARHIGSVLAPIVLFVGCDLLPQAWDTGYSCGYGTADFVLSCNDDLQARQAERNAEIAAWEAACSIPVEEVFSDQATVDDLDAHCEDTWSFGDHVVLCESAELEPGTHPNDCEPFHRPFFGTSLADYDCPGSVAGNRLCLCCDRDTSSQDCRLRGGSCNTDARCCSGNCEEGPPQPIPGSDGGTNPGRGTCQ